MSFMREQGMLQCGLHSLCDLRRRLHCPTSWYATDMQRRPTRSQLKFERGCGNCRWTRAVLLSCACSSANSNRDALPPPGCPIYSGGLKRKRMIVQCVAIRKSSSQSGFLQRHTDMAAHQLLCKRRTGRVQWPSLYPRVVVKPTSLFAAPAEIRLSRFDSHRSEKAV